MMSHLVTPALYPEQWICHCIIAWALSYGLRLAASLVLPNAGDELAM